MPEGGGAFAGIGASVLRKEDARFLTGRGRYLGDMAVAGELHCHILRSPHAHARLRAIETRAAAGAPGVAAVFTGADMEADGIGPMPCLWRIRSEDGTPLAEPPRWAIARGVVRHVGEPVAVVVADRPEQAADAAERIEIEYDVRPAVADAREAVAAGAPLLHEEAAGNVCFRWARGDRAAVEDAFRRADHVVRIELVNNRIAGAALENRCALGAYDPLSDSYLLRATTQAPHLIRRSVAAELDIPEGALRVVAPDMGGGFGYKGKHYPEETIVVWAAKKLRRPVRWTGSRGEGFVSDTQARDHATAAALALDADGRFLGLRVETMANLGAYLSTFGPAIPSAIYGALLAGVYRTPAVSVEVAGIFTNSVPTDAYRGAGRPEACYVLERLCDRAAAALGLDRREIRRRNLIPPEAMPYATPVGPVYDCGDFGRMMACVLEAADYDSFAERRAASARRGLLRGIAVANFVESSGVAPSRLAGALGARAGFFEAAQISVDSAGGVHAFLGTHNHGQAHETTFAQILSDRLGVSFDRIRITEGDTGAVPFGTGTFGSRSIAVGGSALDRAAGKIVAKGKRIAAHLLEAAPSDVEFARGRFAVAGTDRALSFAEIARAAYLPHDYPLEELEPGLNETAYYDPPNFAFSNGSHVCEVEVDPETGFVRLAAYWAVDDIGAVINPMVAEGQIHGGLAQGVGQALMEACRYDREDAQLLSGSFMDYALPRADDLPSFDSAFDQSLPCTHNPLGAKGCGESGSIGAPPAIVSAVLDALRPLGVDDLEMPLTPARVWRAIRSAQPAAGAGSSVGSGPMAPSAKTWRSLGKDRRAAANRPGAPSRSWRLAAWARAAASRPFGTDTETGRLRMKTLLAITVAAILAASQALADAAVRTVTFENEGATLSGALYLPAAAPGKPLPVVVVTGAWTSVQEQMPRVYAREMVERGFAAFTFDFRGWGKSGDLANQVRYKEDPSAKISDIRAAIRFVSTLPEVDAAQINGLGICASAGYMVDAASGNPLVNRVGLVAPWLQHDELVKAVYGGAEGVERLISLSRAAEARGGEIILAAGPEGAEGVLMPIGGYYYDPKRGAIPEYDNRWNRASWEGWLTYYPADNPQRLDKPLAVVHSEAAAIPEGVKSFVKGFTGEATMKWLEDVTQFDFYDNPEDVRRAADVVAEHFRKR